MGESCAMCGSMGWGGMLFMGVLGLSFLALIVFLIVYIAKKIRSSNNFN